MSEEPEENITIGSTQLAHITGSTLQTGDITTTITAGGDIVGRDKIVHHTTQIIQQALSAVEEAEKAHSAAQTRLARGISDYVQRLQQVATDQEDAGAGGPYKGLLAYRLNDAELFFGRQQAVTDLLRCLQRGPLTILHAESGAGKSSLLQAGLSPHLIAQGHLPIYLRSYNLPPGLALKRALAPDLAATPELAAASLPEFLRRVMAVLDHKTTLYLLADQFEELFTLLPETEQASFAAELAACLKDPTLKVCWVLALRSEFFSTLANFRPQIENPFQNEYRLNRLNQAEARQVIIAPAERQGVAFEPAVVEVLLAELHDEKGELSPPQLQLVCSALYSLLLHRQAELPDQSLIMTQALYEAGGRAEGILRGYLNQVLRNNLPTKQARDLARRVLIALVSANGRRLRRTRSGLATQLATGITTTQSLETLLEQLVKSRLLSVQKDEEAGEAGYELIHDYLLTEIEISPEEQARKAAAELLKQEVETYQRYETLLDPRKYEIINSQRDFLELDDPAEELLRLSKEAIEAQAREKEVQQERELAQQRSLAEAQRQRAEAQKQAAVHLRRQALVATGIGVIALVAAVTAGFFGWRANTNFKEAEAQRDTAAQQAQMALAQSLGALAASTNNDDELTTLLALEALRVSPQARATGLWLIDRALREALAQPYFSIPLSGHEDFVNSVAFSPEGTWLASGDEEGTVRLWRLDQPGTEPVLLRGHEGGVRSVAFSPDGT
jgi:hypothetical protein